MGTWKKILPPVFFGVGAALLALCAFYVIDGISNAHRKEGEESATTHAGFVPTVWLGEIDTQGRDAEQAGKEAADATEGAPPVIVSNGVIWDAPVPVQRIKIHRKEDGPVKLEGYHIVCAEGFKYIYYKYRGEDNRAFALTPVFGADRLPARCDEVAK